MRRLPLSLLLSVVVLVLSVAARPVSDDPQDAARRWAEAALRRQMPATQEGPAGLTLRRQDHGELSLGKSVMNTPLQIGDKRYEHGLGSHSVSDILVRLPSSGATFTADAGVDNNYDTAGRRGTVIFTVEVGGKEAFRSDVRRGGQAPIPVRVDLGGARELVLHILDAGDGPGWDQADWAEAAVMLANGERLWLDELQVLPAPATFATSIPFSFIYGGKPSSELLPDWTVRNVKAPKAATKDVESVIYTDPATGLEITCETTIFENSPAVEWVLRLRNKGSGDSPLVESLCPLDLTIDTPAKSDLIFHHSNGSSCAPADFLPIDAILQPNADLRIAPRGGRSSNGPLPFFNMQWKGGGLIGAIGWSGQWELGVKRAGGRLSLKAGQQLTHLSLHPGESIRTPRMLLVWWKGDDYLRGQNSLRRLILDHYTPHPNGELALPLLSANTWFAFNSGNDVTEVNQLESIESMTPLGVEAFWIDAGWFEGGWPSGAGSWVPKAAAFPRGLKPLGDAAHKKGMKFVVWFEPERVNPSSRIANEHPEWVLHAGDGDGLFDLGNPEACAWLTELLSKCISDWAIDVFRNDFNIDPLPFWRATDDADRQGMTEIRYIENLYKLWDELLARHPGLTIDNCASGGRRIDLETTRRSYPLWRSDWTCAGRAVAAGDQVHTAGLSLWLPLHSTGVAKFDPYSFRTVATTGVSICPDTRDPRFPAAQARQMIAEARSLRPLWLGDYYPLLPINVDEDQWCGWQFDRPDLGQGFAMVFRRAQSQYSGADISLRGLDAQASYEVEFVDSSEKRPMKGAELAHLAIKLEKPASCILVKYRKG
ncbi:MAG: alpha-galactosidase [Planctomycetota bacterium]